MNKQLSIFHIKNFLTITAILAGFIAAGSAYALKFEPSDGLTIDLDTTLAYGAAWRTEAIASSAIIPKYSPIATDPTLVGFDTFVLQWNSDDGDRNFNKGDMISNRTAITIDMDMHYNQYGVFLRGQGFYDAVYFNETGWNGKGWDTWAGISTGAPYQMYATDCGSVGGNGVAVSGPLDGIPDTVDDHGPGGVVNISPCNGGGILDSTIYNGAGVYTGPEALNNAMASGDITDPRHFSDRVKDRHGSKVRFLDAYVYGNFDVGGHTLALRLGEQAILWGEALLLQGGIGFAQNRVDAAAATSPGVELKEIFLPTGTLYGQIDLTDSLTLEAYWQYEWKKSELFADGAYWSPNDFLDGNILMVNGHYIDGCMFGLTQTYAGADINGVGGDLNCTGLSGVNDPVTTIVGASHTLANLPNAMYRSNEDATPDGNDQFGVALRMLREGGSEAGIFFVQYHDKYPSVWAGNNGAKDVGAFRMNAADNPAWVGPTGTFQQQFDSVGANILRYTVEYKERINLWGLTYNTVLGDVQMGFELTYRPNQPVVPACSQAEIDATTFDPALSAIAGAPTGTTYDAWQASLTAKGPCKDPSLKYWAGSNGYDFLNKKWAPESHEKLMAWPTQAEVFTGNWGVTLVVPPSPFWDTGIFVAELGGFYVGSGFKDEDLKMTSIGGFTKSGYGVSAIFLPQYKNVMEGVDLTIPMFVNYTIEGSFSYYSYNQGALWASVGLEAVYLSNTRVGIVYSAFGGPNQMWRDRDNIAITAKYTF